MHWKEAPAQKTFFSPNRILLLYKLITVVMNRKNRFFFRADLFRLQRHEVGVSSTEQHALDLLTGSSLQRDFPPAALLH